MEKNITWKKGERRRNIIFHLILRLLARISSREEGKETKIKIFKNGDGEEYQYVLYTALPPGVDRLDRRPGVEAAGRSRGTYIDSSDLLHPRVRVLKRKKSILYSRFR